MDRTIAYGIFEATQLPLLSHWDKWMVCGSYRRGRKQVKDLDLLVIGDYDLTKTVCEGSGYEIITGKGKVTKKHILRVIVEGLQLDMMFVSPEEWGAAAMHHTGPVELNIRHRFMAKRRGYLLNQHGLWDGDTRIAGATEEDVYAALRDKYLTPEQRETYAEKVAA